MSRMVFYGLLVGCAVLAVMIYRHLFADEPIRVEDLRRLILVIPIGALLLWLRRDWLRQVRREAAKRGPDQP